jgi:SAM-dependent methyltransferase
MVKFELISYLGRKLINMKPPINKDRPNLLNLGCAVTTFDGWVNADFYRLPRLSVKQLDGFDWMLDLRYPLNCSSQVWDGIFCEHTIEHLYPLHVYNLLKELRRTMKPGAWLRLSVPDLGKYVSYYLGDVPHEDFLQWSTGCEAICYLTQNHHHLSVWDAPLLISFLEMSGFINIRQTGFREGFDERLLKDREERKWESFYLEAQNIM